MRAKQAKLIRRAHREGLRIRSRAAVAASIVAEMLVRGTLKRPANTSPAQFQAMFTSYMTKSEVNAEVDRILSGQTRRQMRSEFRELQKTAKHPVASRLRREIKILEAAG